jgi:aldehyde dehydrogenase (NAD+)
MKRYECLIDGRWVPPVSGSWMPSIDPYTGQAWCEIPECNEADVDLAVSAADRAFRSGPWSKLTATARGAVLRRFADLIAENADALAEVEVRDNGKLITEMREQFRYIPQWFHYYAGLADKIEGGVLPIDKPGHFVFTKHEPLGVVAAVTAWNSPLLLLTWKLAPGLAAGNTFVVKPSEFASASTLEFARLAETAGTPKGVINVVTGTGQSTGAPLVSHPKVAKTAFTGSDAAGRAINKAAAADFKHVTMELGGKSPNIVFPDADLDAAAAGVASGIFAASGQTCMAGSRLLAHRSIYDELLKRVLALVDAAKVGNPMDPGTQLGPVANIAQYKKVLACIDMAQEDGAVPMRPDMVPARSDDISSLFIKPVILRDVQNSMRIAQQEVFGPVLSAIAFDSDDEALAIANDTIYGLAAGVWTKHMARAFRFVEGIKAGTVWVNTYRAVSFMAPFGGMKQSGLGRESGQETIMSYLQTKTVWIRTGEPQTGNPFVMR